MPFQAHINKGLSWLQVAPPVEPHQAPPKSPTRLSWILHDSNKNRPGKTRLVATQNRTGSGGEGVFSSQSGPRVVDSPVNRLFNPLKVNKEGVDKCFLMEFVHVMGERVHTNSRTCGIVGRRQGAWVRMPRSCGCHRGADEMDRMSQGAWGDQI